MTSSPPSVRAGRSPELLSDRAFWGMTGTQLLGAFNDNLFKQLVMLICVDAYLNLGPAYQLYQSIALALFAIPFVLFSGFAGFLSDRMSKRGIVVAAKVAEIVIMAAGMGAFFAGTIYPDQRFLFLFIVLFLMSTQSAFFGPSKYGILPELFADRDLPQANGIIQMTTFVAIIFGFAAAGLAKEWFQDQLWIVSAMCVGIAVLGTLTSLFVRSTPVAHPGLKFEWSALGINRETWNMLRSDRLLLEVLVISSLFWFLGGVMQPTANTFGKDLLALGDGRTSLLGAFMGIGIALGCLLAGKASHQQINFRLVVFGTWGLIGSLCGLVLLGWGLEPIVAEAAQTAGGQPPPESFVSMLWPESLREFFARLAMLGVGFFGGLFIVPLQVFMQARPPEDQKGRMIGAMNLVNWLAICFAAAFVAMAGAILNAVTLGVHWIFVIMAVILLPVALFYHPPDEELDGEEKPA